MKKGQLIKIRITAIEHVFEYTFLSLQEKRQYKIAINLNPGLCLLWKNSAS